MDDIIHQQEEIQKDISSVQNETISDIQADLGAMSLADDVRYGSLVDLLEDLRTPMHRLEDKVQTVQNGLSSKMQQEILDWVSTVPHRRHHDQAYSDVLPGSGQWFLDHQQLLAWRNAPSSSRVWLHGIPGSGKSKLT